MILILRENITQFLHFLKQTNTYFRDVLLMHSFILFLAIPLLSNGTKFILQLGEITYISFDNFAQLILEHPFITLSLLFVLLSVVMIIYFEFTFLLLSLYFIKQQHPISLKNLLQLTLTQLKKLRPAVFTFFLFYFFLVLPLGGFSLHSELLAKIKLPAFIIDFIFVNRLSVIIAYILIYILLAYLALRLTFTLPAMILLNQPLKKALRESLLFTRKNFWKMTSQLAFITVGLLLLTSACFSLILAIQRFIEAYYPQQALFSAVISLFGLQLIYIVNLVLSTIAIFYLIIEWMDRGGYLLPIPATYFSFDIMNKGEREKLKLRYFIPFIVISVIGVLSYNYLYLSNYSNQPVVSISHRGVSRNNGVQNSIEALIKTSQQFKPDYIEMDVQMTLDETFIAFHDFNFKELTGLNQEPEKSTLQETSQLIVHENKQKAKIPTFNFYLEEAKKQKQKLLIEIKTQRKELAPLINQFLNQYQKRILEEGHIIQSLSYPLVEALKKEAPELTVGYIIPFNFIGPPLTHADFLTMEYSTLNRAFIDAAHEDGKMVFTWTPNKKETMERMIFYGVDGIVTDRLDQFPTKNLTPEKMTYSDKLAYFLIGVG